MSSPLKALRVRTRWLAWLLRDQRRELRYHRGRLAAERREIARLRDKLELYEYGHDELLAIKSGPPR